MSCDVVNLIYSKRIGSAHRKAVLAYCADRASSDGKGVFCSKLRISVETEIARSTVFKIMSEFVVEGILVEAGQRVCGHGYTVVYNMNLDAISSYPDVVKRPKNIPLPEDVHGSTRPAARPHPSGSQTPSRPVAGPKPSLEQSLNSGGGDASVREVGISLGQSQHLREKVLHAIGVDGSGLTGHGGRIIGTQADMAEVARWLALPGLTEAVVLKEIGAVMGKKRDGPPNSFRFFTRAMERLSGSLTQPPLKPIRTIHGESYVQTRQTSAAINELSRRVNSGEIELGTGRFDKFER